MAYDIGPKISLKGEKEYQKAIASINTELKQYGAELKNVSAEMDSQGQTMELLEKKNELLEKQYDAQHRKLKEYQAQLEKHIQKQEQQAKALDEAREKFGANSKEAAKAQRAYDATSSSIDKLNLGITETSTFLVKTSSEIDKNKKAMDSMGSASDQLEAKIKSQKQALDQAKDAYVQYALHNDTSSQKAQQLKNEITRLSSELNDSKSKLSQAQKEADDLANAFDDAGESAKDAGEGFTVMKGALADLISDGLQKGADKLIDIAGNMKDFALESETSLSKFGAQTGATAEELDAFKTQIQDMYVNNFGESLADLGDKMAYVKQVTGEVDPSKLKELTENAMTLEDTFGSDFNETIRGVTNLMYHFGISSEEAFDLFAKGSQLGLDYTGELGDNVAEYAGNFEQAGYTAEEYFQLLVNGSKNGAYNLDKVNDSINEVKNRLGDGTIGENLALFSQGTQNLYQQWEQGKATMKDVIDSIVGDINNCTNEQDALTMAATAFGTMGEDANLNVVKSLTSVGTSLDDVNGKMEQIKQQRYDNAAASFEALGRKIQMEVILPIAEKLLPILQQVVDFIANNLPALMPIIAAFGGLLVSAFVINGISTTITSIQNIIGLVQGLPTLMPILEGIKGAVSGLFSLIAAHPVVAVIMAIVAAVTYLYNHCEWFRDAVNAVIKAIGDFFGEVFGGLVTWFSETLPNSLSQFWNSLKTGWDNMCNGLASNWSAMWNKIKSVMDTIINFVKNNWAGLLLFLVNPFAGAFKLLYDNCDGFRNFVNTWIGKIGSIISGTLGGFWDKAKNWGSDLIHGFIEGIKSGIGWLTDTVKGIAGKVASFLHFSVPDEGPLSDFDESGGDMIDLLIEGMRDKKGRLVDTVREMAEAMQMDNSFAIGGTGEIMITMPIYLDGRRIQQSVNRVSIQNADAARIARGE